MLCKFTAAVNDFINDQKFCLKRFMAPLLSRLTITVSYANTSQLGMKEQTQPVVNQLAVA